MNPVGARVRDVYAPLPALRQVEAPRRIGQIARLLVVLFGALLVGLAVLPWQQTAPGSGRVLAWAPDERSQSVDAPVSGRVERWLVREGDRVAAGDPIVELRDNDPELMDRMQRDRLTLEASLEAARLRIQAYEEKLIATSEGVDAAESAATAKVDAARQKRLAERDGLLAEEAALDAARLNLHRTQALAAEGLKSTFDVEQAILREQTSAAKVRQAQAKVEEAEANLRNAEGERAKTVREAEAKVSGVEGELQDALAKEAAARSKLISMDTKMSRQQAQAVVAPRAGVIQRLLGGQGGEQVKTGDSLAVLVPDTDEIAVEIKVSGNDVPLITPGQKVRLQFEGWPAIQFAGWPGAAIGTFGGTVAFLDPSDDGTGNFRALIIPDPDDEPWPDRVWLRQGARTKGWVLLSVVPLGFELWRQLNGFPPSTEAPVGAIKDTKGGGKAKGGDASKDKGEAEVEADGD
ncbi:MAG: HlyD family efflux transporter periplasmic adaptor subunit [Deltaproteobacteria bacterium]|jgi:adhesin transport system membrane fusion protein|nr:HlyD family efflux transporter periplasmic adaptor subunit [Deltaproteobacteria bacterium]